MFSKNSINETCFYNKLVDIAYDNYNTSALDCQSFFISLVEYLESNTIVECSKCGYFFNYDSEGVYDGSQYYCDDCKPEDDHIMPYHGYRIVNNSQTVDTFGIELEVEFPNNGIAEECAEEVYNT